MTLAIGKFQVSKYAAPQQGGAAGGLDFGLNPGMGNQFGVDGAGQLVPSNVFPQVIGPGGEIMPGGGSPFLPGGVPMDPAYAGGPGPMWDTSGLPGRPGRGGRRFGSRIINVNLPKIITAGQPFPIIVTYTHVGEAFGSYKIKVNIPVFQIMETSPEKRVASGGQDNIVINLTAPAPLPDAAVTGTVELVQTEGNEVTIDSEIITLPTEKVPNPPTPIPPVPIPPPSPPPTMPPPPPVPLPPVLQLITLTITRGEDGGHQAIIIQAVGLEPSEPTTLFIYLSSRPTQDWRRDLQYRLQSVARKTGAGSIAEASSNIAYAYPAVSIQGITPNGNGLRLSNNRMLNNIQSRTRPEIQQLVNERVKERLNMAPQGRVEQMIQQLTRNDTATASSLRNDIESRVQQVIAQAIGGSGGPGAAAIAVGEPHPNIPIFKRQRVSLTASDQGTIRHVVRIREAQIGTPLNGFVIAYGHRSKRHSGRRPFSL